MSEQLQLYVVIAVVLLAVVGLIVKMRRPGCCHKKSGTKCNDCDGCEGCECHRRTPPKKNT